MPDYEVLTTRSPDGAELDLSPHGAHVLGWRPASGGERLWVSSLATTPSLRGGIPVVFPQFADRGPLQKHGFARDRLWEVVAVGGGRALLTLEADDATRAIWPHEFSLELTAEVIGERLEVDITVSNTGSVAWSFNAALHSYLAVAGLPSVVGVGGHVAEDNASGGSSTLPSGDLVAHPPLDLAVRGAHGPRGLTGGAYGDLVLTTGGFTDTVVWNPGEDHPADIDDPTCFVCVEPALLAPLTLEPGAVWRGSMRLLAGTRVDDPNGVQPGG